MLKGGSNMDSHSANDACITRTAVWFNAEPLLQPEITRPLRPLVKELAGGFHFVQSH